LDDSEWDGTYFVTPPAVALACGSKLPTAVANTLKECPDVALVGGALRVMHESDGGMVNDYDLAVVGRDRARPLAVAKVVARTAGELITFYPNSFQVAGFKHGPIQVLRYMQPDPVSTLKSFDFTVTKAMIWWDSAMKRWAGLEHINFASHAAEKILIYEDCNHRDNWPGTSLMRIPKFARYGYAVDRYSMIKLVAEAVNSVDEWYEKLLERQDRVYREFWRKCEPSSEKMMLEYKLSTVAVLSNGGASL
jgi:hypothetical protein